MSENQILQQVADRITDRPFRVVVPYKQLLWWQKLQVSLRLMKPYRAFMVKPITVGNFERIAPVINRIPGVELNDSLVTSFPVNGLQHLDDYLYIIAVGLTNKKKAPGTALLSWLKQELTWGEVAGIFEQIMAQLGTQGFIRSTVLIKGSEMMTGPTTGKIIAPETPGLP